MQAYAKKILSEKTDDTRTSKSLSIVPSRAKLALLQTSSATEPLPKEIICSILATD